MNIPQIPFYMANQTSAVAVTDRKTMYEVYSCDDTHSIEVCEPDTALIQIAIYGMEPITEAEFMDRYNQAQHSVAMKPKPVLQPF